MRFTLSAAALLALASSALAQTAGFDVISSPKKDQKVDAGSTFEIVWAPDAKHKGTVTISLLGGPAFDKLHPVSTLKAGVDSSAGKYSWAVDKSLGSDPTYGIRIALDSDDTIFQYSFPFHIEGKSTGSNPSNATSTTGSTYTTAAPSSNLSTTGGSPTGGGPTVVTLTSTAGSGSSSNTASASSPIPTSGAGVAAQAGSFVALFGGVAAAVFAL